MGAMTDTERKALVERLWEVGRDGVWKSGRNPTSAHPMCIEAANQIEADGQRIAELEAQIERLRAVGDRVADAAYHGEECPMNTTGAYCNCGYEEAAVSWTLARAALGDKTDD